MRYNTTIPPRLTEVEQAFSRKALRRICEADEHSFGKTYGMERYSVPEQPAPDNFYFYKDNGSNILAVAHLDTVGHADDRICRFVTTEGGLVVFSRALDDRLGAYIILDLLPKLGLNYDILLTVGEESGRSTAAYFDQPDGKQYDYMIEFDRGGTDVVMYQYDDTEVRDLVKACGARVGDGSFSDISYLGHLGIKGFNWGVGYQDYHGPRAHAFLDDTFMMVAKYLKFAEQNDGVAMPHYEADEPSWYGSPSRRQQSVWWDDDDYCEGPNNGHTFDYLADEDNPEDAAWARDVDMLDDPDAPDYDEYPSLRDLSRVIDVVVGRPNT